MDAQLLTVQKLEEKERALQGSLGGVEKELTLRSQALELNKRKVRLYVKVQRPGMLAHTLTL